MTKGLSTTVWPAVIIGGSILAAGWMVTRSLDETAVRLGEIKTGLGETKVALEEVAKARPASPSRRRGPDPNKVYTIASNGAPAKGPQSAKVKIYEFSDFQ